VDIRSDEGASNNYLSNEQGDFYIHFIITLFMRNTYAIYFRNVLMTAS